MKKIFLFISIFVLVIALCLYLFNPNKDYHFMSAIEACSQLEFKNPLDQFKNLIFEFEKFGDLFSGSYSFWDGVGKFFELIWNVLKAPVLLLGDLFVDIGLLFKCILYIIGFY